MIPVSMDAVATRYGPAGAAWVDRLPELIARFAKAWGVDDLAPLAGCGSAAWVGGGTRDGTEVVLKLSWPHPEAATEAAGLRFFAGRGAVQLLEAGESEFALLLERCRPGDDLWSLSTAEADEVEASVLRSLWRVPTEPVVPITTLAATVAEWNAAYPTAEWSTYPRALVADAARVGNQLIASTTDAVVVHGDLNPFNVLSSQRGGWLAIDPKPLLGDPAYDLAQYLGNRVEEAEASRDPTGWMASRIRFFARALGLDAYRIAAWAFVKAVGWTWGSRTADLFKTIADDAR